MAKVIANTTKLEDLVNDLNSCVKLYEESIDSFFNIMLKMKGWEGKAAFEYLSKIETDKPKYVDFGDYMYKYTETLSNVSGLLQECISSSTKE